MENLEPLHHLEPLQMVRIIRYCVSSTECRECRLAKERYCTGKLMVMAADALEKAEVDLRAMRGAARSFKDENAIIRDAFNKLQAEHKALLEDMKAMGRESITSCEYCKHNGSIPCDCVEELDFALTKCDTCDHPCKCHDCHEGSGFEWRGIVEANEQEGE